MYARNVVVDASTIPLTSRSWQAKSAADHGLFEQMSSVKQFMEDLADGIRSLTEEVVCDEKYYAAAWDAVFAPEAAANRKEREERRIQATFLAIYSSYGT